MRKIQFTFVVVLLLALAGNASYGQGIGINAAGATPDPSAMLDVDATDKGFLPPRIVLTGTTDITTIVSAATGLLVYNTATVSDVIPGYYYWDGSVWSPLSGGSSGGSGMLAYKTMSVIKSGATTGWEDVHMTAAALTFTAPASGNVKVVLQGTARVRGYYSSGSSVSWGVKDNVGLIAGTNQAVLYGYTYASGYQPRTESWLNYSTVITGLTPGNSYTYKWGHAHSSSDNRMTAKLMEVWSLP